MDSRSAGPALCLLAGLAIAPGFAQARSAVSVQGPLFVKTGSGVVNDIRIVDRISRRVDPHQGAFFWVIDKKDGVQVSTPCKRVNATTARCPRTKRVRVFAGSSDDRVFHATRAEARLFGDSGDDLLRGADGDETLDGGEGADRLVGGGGRDTATYHRRSSAEPVSVTLDGQPDDGAAGEGDNVAPSVEGVIGGEGSDVLIGSQSPNRLFGGPGNDRLEGGGESDTLNGGPGADDMSGGQGFPDRVDYSERTAAEPVAVTVGDGLPNDGTSGEGDTVREDVESVTGGAGADTLIGHESGSSLAGGPGNDSLKGGGLHDVFVPGTGTDVVDGGDGGADRVIYSERTGPVRVTLGDGIANEGAPGENDVLLGDITGAFGGMGDDVIIGDDRANALAGGPGDDRLDGHGYVGVAARDFLSGDKGDDVLLGGPGHVLLFGGGGVDRADFSNTAGDGVGVDLADSAPTDGFGPAPLGEVAGVEHVLGGAGPDSLAGDASGNRLTGGGGSDRLDGRGGADRLTGGGGHDRIRAGAGADEIEADDGARDAVDCGPGQDTIAADQKDKLRHCEVVV